MRGVKHNKKKHLFHYYTSLTITNLCKFMKRVSSSYQLAINIVIAKKKTITKVQEIICIVEGTGN